MSTSRHVRRWYPAAALLAVASCGSSAAPSSPSSATPGAPAPRQLAVLGDSLAVSPSRSVNFPAELQERLDAAGLRWTVRNEGVSGDTTADGLRRVDAALTSDTAILVVALGANDGLRGVSVETIERNLSAIIERARTRGIKVLLCGLDMPPVNGWQYTVDYHRLFPGLATKYDVPLVPFFLEGVALVPEMNGPDGLHPNAAGAERIAQTLWPYVQTLIRQTAAATAYGSS